MAKIPSLFPRKLHDGRTAWNWKPSKRLRDKGWTNQRLGVTDGRQPSVAIVQQAMELNERVEQADADGRNGNAPSVPQTYLFSDLVDAYRASPEFREKLKPASRKNYNTRLGQLTEWALDGALPIRSIDRDMVKDLKRELEKGSPWRAADMLRVLRLLLRWAVEERLLGSDPTEGVGIPTPPSRRMKLAWRDVEHFAARAANQHPIAARMAPVAFWSMLRREDLRQLNRFQWRELHGMDPRDVPALANSKGEVWGFRVKPNKTATTSDREVDCPMPPWLHGAINAAFDQSQWLFPHPLDEAQPITAVLTTRRMKALLKWAGFPDHQLRDFRRSGMYGVQDMGAERSDVFAISGHPLLGQASMGDVYMPPDTRAACRAIAAACRTLTAQKAREESK